MWKKVAGYEVKINDNGLIDGVDLFGELKGVYRFDKKLNCYTNVLPLTISAFKSGIYQKRYFVK